MPPFFFPPRSRVNAAKGRQYVFQQDSAPAHTARSTQAQWRRLLFLGTGAQFVWLKTEGETTGAFASE